MTTTKTTGTALEKKAPNAVAVPDEIAALVAEYGQQGLEDMTQNDRVTPFLGLIQGLSPQIDKSKPQYIKGAEVGDIYNTVTGEVYKTEEGGIRAIPVYFQKVWTVWVPRDAGGGFLGSYSDAELSKPLFITPSGAEYPKDGPTQVVETAQHWALLEGKDGTWSPAIIPMKKTQMKASRQWNTLTTMASQKYGAPVFVRVYKLSSVNQVNAKGTFANYKVEDVGFAPPALIKLAAEFRAMIQSGIARPDYEKGAAVEAEVEHDDAGEAKPGKPGF